MKKLRTVGCFLELGGKFLLLHRHPDKPQGNTWGLPAGKVDPGETDLQALLREVWEETGYTISPDKLEFLGDQVFDFPHLHLNFPTYRVILDQPHEVAHRPGEHQAYKWVTPEECYAMPDLIEGLHDLLERVGYIQK